MAATAELLAARPAPDAIYCYNDLIAIGALEGCASRGRRVPDDLATVGYDDILLAHLVSPALTTLRSQKYDLGAAAAMLIGRIEGRAGPDQIVIPTELVVRQSAP